MNGKRDYIVYLHDMLEFTTKGIDFVKGFNLSKFSDDEKCFITDYLELPLY